METIYKHRFSDVANLANYEVMACYPDGTRSVTDPSNEVEWIQTNTPENISGNRFISIVDGQPVLDPEMVTILESEATVIIMQNSYKAMIRRRADRLREQEKFYEALMLLKKIGE